MHPAGQHRLALVLEPRKATSRATSANGSSSGPRPRVPNRSGQPVLGLSASNCAHSTLTTRRDPGHAHPLGRQVELLRAAPVVAHTGNLKQQRLGHRPITHQHDMHIVVLPGARQGCIQAGSAARLRLRPHSRCRTGGSVPNTSRQGQPSPRTKI